MIHILKYDGSVLLTLFFALWSTVSVLGQEDLVYNGGLKVGSYEGNAMYYYKVVDGDTVLNGPFRMERSNLGALLEKKDSTFSFSGNFRNDYPTGDWRFQFGQFKSDSLTRVEGYQYKINVSGIQQESNGSMVNGKPDGNWTIVKNKIEDSEIEKTLFKSNIEFDKGIPQKSFQIEDGESTLVGRFLRDGLAHDEWTLYSKNDIGAVESWYFTNGRLTEIRRGKEGESQRISIYPYTLSSAKIINLDKRFIALLALQQKTEEDISSSAISKLLGENASYYQEIDSILSTLGKSKFLPEFKVQVPYFPLDSLERELLSSLKVNHAQAEKISRSFLEDTQLNILKLSDNEANILYNAIDSIRVKLVEPIGELVSYEKKAILPYVSRKRLMSKIWPNGFPSDIHLKAIDAASAELEEVSLSSTNMIAEYTVQSLDSITKILNAKLLLERRQQEFIALEEQMIAQIKSLNALLDSVNTQLPKDLLDALKNIKSVADTNLSSYSNLKDPEAKLALGRILVDCFMHLEELEKAVLALPGQKDEIITTYQDEIWNPFMANLMKEDVKKELQTPIKRFGFLI
ncbi:hypothetical protein [Maribacter aestuarii]|uniref:hypothetical protein n=1 Tax=Maribacter aestuarii TaxID=1130723 RepID=UPI0025A5A9DE|nr:hypothetical protein [Maribacter aestuarii]